MTKLKIHIISTILNINFMKQKNLRITEYGYQVKRNKVTDSMLGKEAYNG